MHFAEAEGDTLHICIHHQYLLVCLNLSCVNNLNWLTCFRLVLDIHYKAHVSDMILILCAQEYIVLF